MSDINISLGHGVNLNVKVDLETAFDVIEEEYTKLCDLLSSCSKKEFIEANGDFEYERICNRRDILKRVMKQTKQYYKP